MSKLHLTLGVLACLGASSAAAQPTSWNYLSSVPTTQQGMSDYLDGTTGLVDGVWSYTTSEGPFTQVGPAYNDPGPFLLPFQGSGVYIGIGLIHPGLDEVIRIKFTAPQRGFYDLQGIWNDADSGGGNGVNGGINPPRHPGATGGAVSLPTGSQALNLTIDDVFLNAGEVVVFSTSSNGNMLFDATLFDANVTFTDVPEPTSLALLGLGSLLIARRRR